MSGKNKTKKDVEGARFTLGTSVDAETYYTFMYIAKQKGMIPSDALRFLITEFMKNETEGEDNND